MKREIASWMRRWADRVDPKPDDRRVLRSLRPTLTEAGCVVYEIYPPQPSPFTQTVGAATSDTDVDDASDAVVVNLLDRRPPALEMDEDDVEILCQCGHDIGKHVEEVGCIWRIRPRTAAITPSDPSDAFCPCLAFVVSPGGPE